MVLACSLALGEWQGQKLETAYGLGPEMGMETVVDHHTLTHPRSTQLDHRSEEDTRLELWGCSKGGSCEAQSALTLTVASL